MLAEPASSPDLAHVVYGRAPWGSTDLVVAQSWGWGGAARAEECVLPSPVPAAPPHASDLFTGTNVSLCLMLPVIS